MCPVAKGGDTKAYTAFGVRNPCLPVVNPSLSEGVRGRLALRTAREELLLETPASLRRLGLWTSVQSVGSLLPLSSGRRQFAQRPPSAGCGVGEAGVDSAGRSSSKSVGRLATGHRPCRGHGSRGPASQPLLLISQIQIRPRAWPRLGRSDARQAAQLKRTQRTSRGLASASSWRTRWGLLAWLATQDPSAHPGPPVFPGTVPTSGFPPGRLGRWAADTSRPK